MKMNLSFRIRENGCNHAEVEIEAETDGEKAILHLLADSKTAIISRGINEKHEGYRLTKQIYIRPEKNFELEAK